TKVDEALLCGSSIRYVATATSGVDHVDTEYLSDRGIEFSSAAGANAESVTEYVISALFVLLAEQDSMLDDATIGIVGFGHVGSLLAGRLKAAGAHVIVNDPPLEETIGDFAPGYEVVDLETLTSRSDVVTLHVPLEGGGRHPTLHLIDESILASMRPGACLFNTSRGGVVSEKALLAHLERPESGPVVLDVWYNEPEPDPRLLESARLGTPHIAGYGWDGKLEATRRVSAAIREYLGFPIKFADDAGPTFRLEPPGQVGSQAKWCHALIRQMYDIESDSGSYRSAFRAATDTASVFTRHRADYPRRRSFGRYLLSADEVPSSHRKVVDGIGVRIVP
ncbi:MAG: 4-phosphoerythronate dehydrogenase, partial [Rhodothermales bacterium]|nr:4-phosphoerythronate dehydrogenase [Rhodothermales bacterium]